MTPQALYEQVVADYQTADPKEMAHQAGVQVVIGSWHPVTYGECDLIRKVITLNRQAPIPLARVLAHELGHYFVFAYQLSLPKRAEEAFVEEFARCVPT